MINCYTNESDFIFLIIKCDCHFEFLILWFFYTSPIWAVAVLKYFFCIILERTARLWNFIQTPYLLPSWWTWKWERNASWKPNQRLQISSSFHWWPFALVTTKRRLRRSNDWKFHQIRKASAILSGRETTEKMHLCLWKQTIFIWRFSTKFWKLVRVSKTAFRIRCCPKPHLLWMSSSNFSRKNHGKSTLKRKSWR